MANNSYSAVEPFGHAGPLSKLERYWDGFEGMYGLHTSRIDQFDPYAAMSKKPIQYEFIPFEIKQDLPDENWIHDTFNNFVRDEFSINNTTTAKPNTPVIQEEIKLSEEYLYDFVQNSEWENIVKLDLPDDYTEDVMAKNIYKLLCDNRIGSSKNKENISYDDFFCQIQPILKDKRRLLFVLPGLPFKDQNRFRVPFGTECVDFSEIAFITRLHILVQSLYQVHPFGADALVLSDGMLYKDIFYMSKEQVEEYQWRLKYYRNRLNLQGDVSIIDLKDMITRADTNEFLSRLIEHIENIISQQCKETPSFHSLVNGMKWNMNSRLLLEQQTDDEAWAIIKLPRDQVEPYLLSYWDDYHEKAVNAAIHYASVNLMLRWTDLINRYFPESIRCTVHPKPNQFALSMSYPWNGVAWSEKWPRSMRDIRTVPYCSLSEKSSVFLVKMHSTGYPCFFTSEKNDRIFECAKNVLSEDGWNVDNIFGRKFTVYDNTLLYNLGKDDDCFAWERRLMPEEYYTTLLQFRISHYKKYGFGVHAIFMNGTLIGQMGLQVLDERKNQLEFVMFLGKEYTNKGIGSKLLQYLFQRSREEGIENIYAVVRSDNIPATNFVTKFGGKPIKSIPHYHQSGMLYRIPIN